MKAKPFDCFTSTTVDVASTDESHEETAAYLQDYNEEWSRSFTRTATFALLNEHFQSLDEQVRQTIPASYVRKYPMGSCLLWKIYKGEVFTER